MFFFIITAHLWEFCYLFWNNMYISLLLKMTSGFSWPAKIMASPFNQRKFLLGYRRPFMCRSCSLNITCYFSNKWMEFNFWFATCAVIKLQFYINSCFKGCGMGTLFVLVSPCFRENVDVTCKIGSFLCSLDNLLQKNVVVFFFENHILKWRSFEKRAIFELLFTFFSHQG